MQRIVCLATIIFESEEAQRHLTDESLWASEDAMPRFHFNVHDGFVRPDMKGVELADLQAARRKAVELAGGILEAEADRIAFGEVWYMEVANDAQQIIFRLEFRVSESPSKSVPLNRTRA